MLMRNIHKITLLVLLSVSSIFLKAQSPTGFPLPNAPTSYYNIGWLRADSGIIPALRDTNFRPLFPGTSVFWLHSGVDSVSWVWDGNKWKRGGGVSTFNSRSGNVTLLSSDVTGALGFTPLSNITGYLQGGSNVTVTGLGTLASPYVINSTGSGGGGTVTSFSFTNGNGITGTVTSPTTTPNLSLGTSLTGIISGNGTGFGTVSIGSGLSYSGGVLSATGGTSLNGLVSANGSAFTTATIGAGLSFSGNTLINTINNTNQLTNGAGFITNITGLVTAGTNISISGSGTSVSPYIINASGGTGTVTTFSSGNLSPLFTTFVSNPNTIPALSFSLSNALANSVFGNNTGSSAAPVYYVPTSTTLNGWFGGTIQGQITLTTTGSGAATFVSNVLNIPVSGGGGSIGSSPLRQMYYGAINDTTTGYKFHFQPYADKYFIDTATSTQQAISGGNSILLSTGVRLLVATGNGTDPGDGGASSIWMYSTANNGHSYFGKTNIFPLSSVTGATALFSPSFALLTNDTVLCTFIAQTSSSPYTSQIMMSKGYRGGSWSTPVIIYSVTNTYFNAASGRLFRTLKGTLLQPFETFLGTGVPASPGNYQGNFLISNNNGASWRLSPVNFINPDTNAVESGFYQVNDSTLWWYARSAKQGYVLGNYCTTNDTSYNTWANVYNMNIISPNANVYIYHNPVNDLLIATVCNTTSTNLVLTNKNNIDVWTCQYGNNYQLEGTVDSILTPSRLRNNYWRRNFVLDTTKSTGQLIGVSEIQSLNDSAYTFNAIYLSASNGWISMRLYTISPDRFTLQTIPYNTNYIVGTNKAGGAIPGLYLSGRTINSGIGVIINADSLGFGTSTSVSISFQIAASHILDISQKETKLFNTGGLLVNVSGGGAESNITDDGTFYYNSTLHNLRIDNTAQGHFETIVQTDTFTTKQYNYTQLTWKSINTTGIFNFSNTDVTTSHFTDIRFQRNLNGNNNLGTGTTLGQLNANTMTQLYFISSPYTNSGISTVNIGIKSINKAGTQQQIFLVSAEGNLCVGPSVTDGENGLVQISAASATRAQVVLNGGGTDPTTPTNGFLWYNNVAHALYFRENGVTYNLLAGGAPTLTYSQNATNNNLSITGGSNVNFLTATTNSSGLLDTARTRFIDSLKSGLKTFNLYAANGLTATGGDSILWGGTLTQATIILGASKQVQLGTPASHIGGFYVQADTVNLASTAWISLNGAINFVSVTSATGTTNYTVITDVFLELPSPTANRTITLPSASGNTGRWLNILDQSTSTSNNWSFATTVKDQGGNTVTNLQNGFGYILVSDGTTWQLHAAYSNTNNKYNASADVTSQTGAVTVTSYAVPGSGSFNTFRVGGYVTVNSVATDILQLQVTWTDETNTSRTQPFFPIGTTTANISSNGLAPLSPYDIRVKQGTTITIATTLVVGTGSISYDAGSSIIQIN